MSQLEIDTFKHLPELMRGSWPGLIDRLNGLDLDEITEGVKKLQDSVRRSARS